MTSDSSPQSGPPAFGHDYRLTPVDRFGVWLSARRMRHEVGPFAGKRLGDFGCGYEASLARTVLDDVDTAALVDLSLAPDLLAHPKVRAVEGNLPGALSAFASASLDIVLCTSVLEHLWEPLDALKEFHRLLAPGGVCFINVPSWRGKRALELSAFRLHLSPADSIDDHKNYYDPKDLWPLVVRAGFHPQQVRCSRHKFGLNTFAVCRVGR